MTLVVLPIKTSECKEWFLHKHYAKRIPTTSYAFGLYDDTTLVGVCSYARPMAHPLVKAAFSGFYQDTFLELNRLVINEGQKKNARSFFVSQSLKLLPKPNVVVSYADTSQHHHGYIYQATNWIYTGLSAKKRDFKVRGLEHLHAATLTDSVGRSDKNPGVKGNLTKLLKEKYGDDLYKVDRPRKHRYFYLLGSKKQRREMLKNLAYPIEPYPKGDNIRYNNDYEPDTQGILI